MLLSSLAEVYQLQGTVRPGAASVNTTYAYNARSAMLQRYDLKLRRSS